MMIKLEFYSLNRTIIQYRDGLYILHLKQFTIIQKDYFIPSFLHYGWEVYNFYI